MAPTTTANAPFRRSVVMVSFHLEPRGLHRAVGLRHTFAFDSPAVAQIATIRTLVVGVAIGSDCRRADLERDGRTSAGEAADRAVERHSPRRCGGRRGRGRGRPPRRAWAWAWASASEWEWAPESARAWARAELGQRAQQPASRCSSALR